MASNEKETRLKRDKKILKRLKKRFRNARRKARRAEKEGFLFVR